MKTIFISGKIGEYPISEAVKQKFAEKEKQLKAKGYEVINPMGSEIQEELERAAMEVGLPNTKGKDPSYTVALSYTILHLTECDAIYMLPDFMSSPGAKAEHAFAIACGIEVIYDEELYKTGTLRK